jgi:hypothetical protein
MRNDQFILFMVHDLSGILKVITLEQAWLPYGLYRFRGSSHRCSRIQLVVGGQLAQMSTC